MALSFDFHMNVVASMFVPWLYYYHFNKRYVAVIIMSLLMMFSKENMALWMPFLVLSFALLNKRTIREMLRFELPIVIVGFTYAFIVLGVIMPSLDHNEVNIQMVRYKNLGDNQKPY